MYLVVFPAAALTQVAALQAALHEAIAYGNAHPEESKSIDEVRALIPKWIQPQGRSTAGTANYGTCPIIHPHE